MQDKQLPINHTQRQEMEIHQLEPFSTCYQRPPQNTQSQLPHQTSHQLETGSSIQTGKIPIPTHPNTHTATQHVEYKEFNTPHGGPKRNPVPKKH
jgi:hypothetical protein